MVETSPHIQEEATRARLGRPWWMACLMGCLFLAIALFVGGYALYYLLFGTPVQEINMLPTNFPQDIALYDLPGIKSIHQVSGQNRGKFLTLLSGPMKMMSVAIGNGTSTSSAYEFDQKMEETVKSMEVMNITTLEWGSVSTTREEVASYYTRLFQKIGMTIEKQVSDQSGVIRLLGTRETSGMRVEISGNPENDQVDKIVVVVHYR